MSDPERDIQKERAVIKILITSCLVAVAVATTSGQQTFTGVVTDSMCANADHSVMRMGPTDAECTVACVFAHDSSYVLFDGDEAYGLSDQRTPREFAGQKVTVTGTLNAETRTIEVDSIAAAE